MDASAGARQFSAASLERLQQHSLFRFQIQDPQVRARVEELQEMLVMAKDEHDHFEIVTELVHMIEDEIHDSDARELYLLASLQHFTHEMEMLLEMDTEAELNPDDMPSFASIFARESSKQTASKPARTNNSKTQRAATPAATTSSTPSGKSATLVQSKSIAVAQQQQEPAVPKQERQAISAAAAAPPQRMQAQQREQPTATAPPNRQQSQPEQRIQSQGQSSNTGSADNATEIEDDLPCSVCFDGDSLEGDAIVICELCGVAVHQTCYRVAFLPEGDWYCHPCLRYLKEQDVEKDVTPTHELPCAVCLTKGGAMVPTAEGDWMHMSCSMYLPELYVQRKGDRGEVICGVEKLKARRKLRCCFCKKTDKAACAQCAYGKCTVSYHVQCALKNKISFAFIEAQRQFGSGCLAHQAKFLSMDGLNADDDDETDAKVVPAQSPAEQQRQTPSAKQEKAKQAKLDKKPPKEKKKARASSWEDDGGNEKDEHVLIASDSEDDEQLHESTEGNADNVQFLKVQKQNEQKPGSMKKRQAKLDNAKKSRQSTLQFGFVKPSIVTVGSVAPPVALRNAATPSAASSSNSSAASHRVLQSRVFVPAYYPPGLQNGDGDQEYEYVMILIQSQPIGMVIESKLTQEGAAIFVNGPKTRNEVVVEALRREVIQDGDEVFAMNQSVLRNLSFPAVHELISKLACPIQCWFRTKRRSHPPLAFAPTMSAAASRHHQTELRNVAQTEAKRQDTHNELAKDVSASASSNSPAKDLTAVALPGKSKQTGEEDGLSVDWPWFFLRSDGKIAMNLFWRSLDGAFFLSKINKRKLLDLQNTVETMIGVRFSRDHAEYEQVQDLLVMPKREFLPPYIADFRKSRKQKKKFLSSDIFMGVSAETLKDEDEVDEQTPINVGTVVTVAKRTWAGINKLGGAGRVRRVHEVTLEEGKKRFTYDIGYVLGGGEKKVERKYISVVDLNKEEEKPATEGTGTEAAEASTSAGGDDGESSLVKMRLSFQVERSNDETLLVALAALGMSQNQPVPTRRMFEFQICAENGNVHLQRKTTGGEQGGAVAKDLLLHKHFEVKLSDEDAIVKASFQPTLLVAAERAPDDVDDLEDEDESDNDEEDEIKSQLECLQQEFGTLLTRNQNTFASIKSKIEQEYATKAYRKRSLEEIHQKHYEQMYRDIEVAKDQFDESDEDNESDDDGVPRDQRAPKRIKIKEPVSSDEDDEDDEDDSFGGLFVNKIKQEGDEVCLLCELSGGDFAATSCGRVVHPQCAMYTPETYFKDGVCHGIAQIPSARRSLSCAICHTRKGLSKIQCAHKRCMVAYHISCAYINGFLIRDPHYQAWCPKHLKSSGMAHEVELPKHLQKASEQSGGQGRGAATKQKKRASHGKKGRRETPRAEKAEHPGAISSSKTDKKRKRKNAAARSDSVDLDGEDKLDADGRSCVRRLDINEDSEGEIVAGAAATGEAARAQDIAPWVPTQVFKENDVVLVLPREWVGSNKPGGVARIRAVHKTFSEDGGGKEALFYDVAYVLSSTKERHVEAEFVRAYVNTEQQSAGPTSSSRKKSRIV